MQLSTPANRQCRFVLKLFDVTVSNPKENYLYHHGVREISAFILAGGKSSRMGSDKAFLELEGRSMLDRALELAKSISDLVKIVGDPAKFASFGPVIPDVFSGQGPLGGIHAALASSPTKLNLILGIDLPLVNAQLLNFLLDKAQKSNAVVTVPFVAGHYQTLCAIYQKQFSVIAEGALMHGQNKIDALFPGIAIRVIEEPELARRGLDPRAFHNVNTPEEWAQAKRALDPSAQHL